MARGGGPLNERGLTAKQELFVAEYLVDLNATQAAKRAGYSEKTAHRIGGENVQKPAIVAAIDEAKRARAERLNLSQDDILRGLAEIAMGDCDDAKAGDRIRAYELIGKHGGMFVERRMDMTGQEVLDRLDKGRERVEASRKPLEVIDGGKDVA